MAVIVITSLIEYVQQESLDSIVRKLVAPCVYVVHYQTIYARNIVVHVSIHVRLVIMGSSVNIIVDIA